LPATARFLEIVQQVIFADPGRGDLFIEKGSRGAQRLQVGGRAAGPRWDKEADGFAVPGDGDRIGYIN
jgi:hypothetical protein